MTQAETVLDPRLSRRRLLQAAAASVPAVAGLGSLGPLAAAPARADGAILKPLPPEWFTILGTNAETRLEALKGMGYFRRRALLRPRPHRDAARRPTPGGSDLGRGLRGGRSSFSYDQLPALPSIEHLRHRVRRQRPLVFGTSRGRRCPARVKLGAIGVARWRGVLLARLLERAGSAATPST